MSGIMAAFFVTLEKAMYCCGRWTVVLADLESVITIA